MRFLQSYIIFLLSFFICSSAFAQQYTFSGKVFDDKKEPLYYAVVNLKGTSMYDMTDEDGAFVIENVPAGKYTLLATILGYQQIEKEIEVSGNISDYKIILKEMTLALDDVVVTAKVSQSKEGSTTYKIDDEAIKQVQAMSVGDLMQLIPGAEIGASSLNRSATIDLRNAGDYSSVNSRGTAVIVDGNQMSNDANMQTEGSVVTANKGIDLRDISAANIESVEVVAGVPSAKYGNVTSGAVIIKRKAGFSPYRFNFNSTPNSYQLGVNKGYKLKGSFLNVDFDYTYSNASPVSRKKYYQRINTGVRWTKNLSKKLDWNHNMYLRYGLSFDGQREDPDELFVTNESENMSNNFTATTNGSMKFLGRLNYSLSANYSHQYAYSMTSLGGPYPIIESLEEGTYITGYTPILFQQKIQTLGSPLNINGTIDVNQTFNTFAFRHNTSTGFSYSFDKNYGEGLVMDTANNAATGLAGQREMNFYNVPASEVYSAFFQDDISLERENSKYLFKLGLRYDNMLRRYNLLSPRLSFSGKFYQKYRLRAAYGISYRTPSMLQLYPGPNYFDVINLNHYSEEDIRSLAVVTTYIHQPSFEDLKPSKGTTLEGGIDYENNDYSFRLTIYNKKIEDGISSFNQLLTFDRIVWESLSETPGEVPELVPTDDTVRVSSTFNIYGNIVNTETNGVEFTASFPKIKATNTRITFSGSYLETTTENNTLNIRSSASLNGASKNRYGVYERPVYKRTNSRSNLTIAQHIPQIKMMVTFITEISWIKKKDVYEYPSPYPTGYYSIDGNYYEIPETERTSAEYEDLYWNASYYNETPVPTYFDFHVQLRKETKQGHSFSFYANNFIWYNPTYIDPHNNSIVTLNSRVTFGIGFNFKL